MPPTFSDDDLMKAADMPAAIPRRPPPRNNNGPRQPVHEPVHESAHGGVVARGRDGEELSRRRTGSNDPFDFPNNDPEFAYQWIAHSVTGSTEAVQDQLLGMLENGWRPVMADRFPGRFMPLGHKGHIIRGGEGLYERPRILNDEARKEEQAKAEALMRDRDQSLMGGKAGLRNHMAMSGYSMDVRGMGGDLRMSIDRGLDIPRPQHTIAGSDE